MLGDTSATRVSVPLGGIAVFGSLVGSFTLGLQSQFTFVSTVLPVFDTWHDAALWTTIFLKLIAPNLLAAGGAFYLTTSNRRPVGSVVASFVVGGLLFGVGLATIASFGPQPVGRYEHVFWMTVVFVGVASLGALGGDLLGQSLSESPQ